MPQLKLSPEPRLDESRVPARCSGEVIDVSILVMAYNEEASVVDVLREIDATMRPSEFAYEIIIIDDGSSDDTGKLADAAARDIPRIRVVHHRSNLGIGEVYRSGFDAARGTFVTAIPADGQFPASLITEFAALVSTADLALGFLPDIKRPPLGAILSWLERRLYRLMFGPLPSFQGLMMFRRSLLAELGVKSRGRGWAIIMEIIVRATRQRKAIVRIPTSLRPRRSGTSKVNNMRNILANFRQALVLWQMLRREARAA
jgi:glycosyltransferase involved in cell wall biosynthesis